MPIETDNNAPLSKIYTLVSRNWRLLSFLCEAVTIVRIIVFGVTFGMFLKLCFELRLCHGVCVAQACILLLFRSDSIFAAVFVGLISINFIEVPYKDSKMARVCLLILFRWLAFVSGYCDVKIAEEKLSEMSHQNTSIREENYFWYFDFSFSTCLLLTALFLIEIAW